MKKAAALCGSFLLDLLEFNAFLTRLVVALYDLQDLFSGIEQVADGTVVIEGINDISKILAHTAAYIPGAVLQLGLLVNEVGSNDLVKDADLFAEVLAF